MALSSTMASSVLEDSLNADEPSPRTSHDAGRMEEAREEEGGEEEQEQEEEQEEEEEEYEEEFEDEYDEDEGQRETAMEKDKVEMAGDEPYQPAREDQQRSPVGSRSASRASERSDATQTLSSEHTGRPGAASPHDHDDTDRRSDHSQSSGAEPEPTAGPAAAAAAPTVSSDSEQPEPQGKAQAQAAPQAAPPRTTLLPMAATAEKISSFNDFLGGLDLSASLESASLTGAATMPLNTEPVVLSTAAPTAAPATERSQTPPHVAATSAQLSGSTAAFATARPSQSIVHKPSTAPSPARSSVTSASRIPRLATPLATTSPSRPSAEQKAYVLEARCAALQEQLRLVRAQAETVSSATHDLPTLTALREQDTLLAEYQRDNARLHAELRAMRDGDKLAYAKMHGENSRLQAENFRLRSQVEALEAQLGGAGLVSDDRIAGLEARLAQAQAEAAEAHAAAGREALTWRSECDQLQQALAAAESHAEARHARELAQLREQRADALTAAATHEREAAEARTALAAAEHDAASARAAEAALRTTVARLGAADAKETEAAISARSVSGAQPAQATTAAAGAPSVARTETSRTLLQPDDVPTVTVLRGDVARLREERDALAVQLGDARAEARAQLEELHAAFAAHRDRAAEREQELERALVEARQERALRPHTRVRDLERELAAVLARRGPGTDSTAAAISDADGDAGKTSLPSPPPSPPRSPLAQSSPAPVATHTDAEVAELQAALAASRARARNFSQEAQIQQTAIADLQARLDAALALSERHRTAKDAAVQRATAQLAEVRGECTRKVQRLEDAFARHAANEGALQGLQLLVERLQAELERAPAAHVVADYERRLREAEHARDMLQADLHVARQYQSPTMQHFQLLQAQVRQLEEGSARRELQLKAVVAQRDRAAALAREEADEHWRTRLQKKVRVGVC